MNNGGEERVGIRFGAETTEVSAARARISELRSELERLARDYSDNRIGAGEYLKQSASLNRELEQTTARLERIERAMESTTRATTRAESEMSRMLPTMEHLKTHTNSTADGFGRSGMMVYQFGQAMSDMSYGLVYGLNNLSMMAATLGIGGAWGVGIQLGIAGVEVLSRNFENLTKVFDGNADSVAKHVEKLKEQNTQLSANAKEAQRIVELEKEREANAKAVRDMRGDRDDAKAGRSKSAVEAVGGRVAREDILKLMEAAGFSEPVDREIYSRGMAEQLAGDLAGNRGRGLQINAEERLSDWNRKAGGFFDRTELGARMRFGSPDEVAARQQGDAARRQEAAAQYNRDVETNMTDAMEAVRQDRERKAAEKESEAASKNDAPARAAQERARREAMVKEDAARATEVDRAREMMEADPAIRANIQAMQQRFGVSPQVQATIRRAVEQYLQEKELAGGEAMSGPDRRAMAGRLVEQATMGGVVRIQGELVNNQAQAAVELQQIRIELDQQAERLKLIQRTFQRMGR
jgi:hypothetical protein